MCMIINKEKTLNIKLDSGLLDKDIKVYKVLKKIDKGLKSYYESFDWRPGKITMDNINSENYQEIIRNILYNRILNGLYVFTNYQDAVMFTKFNPGAYDDLVIVELIANYSNFIAVGEDRNTRLPCYIFTKLTFSEEEYKRATQ